MGMKRDAGEGGADETESGVLRSEGGLAGLTDLTGLDEGGRRAKGLAGGRRRLLARVVTAPACLGCLDLAMVGWTLDILVAGLLS